MESTTALTGIAGSHRPTTLARMAGATRVTRPGLDSAISFAIPKAMARQLNITGPVIAAATLAAVLVASAIPADARGGGHGFACGFSAMADTDRNSREVPVTTTMHTSRRHRMTATSC